MKQIIMTGENTYRVVEFSEIEGLFNKYTPARNQSFWCKQFMKGNTKKEFAEMFEPKELWDRRTYEIISLSAGRDKREFVRRNKIQSVWVRGGAPVTGGFTVLGRARQFKYMDSVPVMWEGKFYAVSSGDAEALLLKYQCMEMTEKTELSSEPFEYLKL